MSIDASFDWDVFLSHATADKPLIRHVAARLRSKGVKVWLDEDTVRLGEHIFGSVEAGLQKSRTLIFFASSASLGSEWAKLEFRSAIFRDPGNKDRRFLVIVLEDVDLPDIIRGFRYIKWEKICEDEIIDENSRWCANENLGNSEKITYHNVFTPSAPPSVPDLLVGRSEQLRTIQDFLRSPGMHPIVVGPRGIGKTSFVHAAMRDELFQRRSIIEVNTVGDFDACCRVVLSDLERKPPDCDITPAIFLRCLQEFDTKCVVSVDELDDVSHKSRTQELFAKFAKAASNQATNLSTKFIFSGIGSDAHDLFAGHLSSRRNLPQILLKDLTEEDFITFLERAEKLLSISIPKHITRELCADADGFPYYIHLVCFHMFSFHGKEISSTSITDRNFVDGKQAALESSFTHYLKNYKDTIYRLSAAHEAILHEMLNSRRRRYAYDEIVANSAIRAQCKPTEINAALRFLYDNNYLNYRSGDKSIGFFDPILRPFLKNRLGIISRRPARKPRSASPDGQPELI